MSERRYFWILDPAGLDQIKIPLFGWVQAALVLGAFLFLGGYLVAVWYLDRTIAFKSKSDQKSADVRRRLAPAGLDDAAMSALYRVAHAHSEAKLYRVLGEPVGFETRVHEALESGESQGLECIPRVREHLGYTADNYLVPLVSTRQLTVGIGVRLSPRGTGPSGHHYGSVDAVGDGGFTIRLGQDGLNPSESAASDMDLVILRGQDLEHRFPFVPDGPIRNPTRVRLRHVLAEGRQRPRQIRLPVLLDVNFDVRVPHGSGVDDLDPDLAPSEIERGVLYDLSDGGFALISQRDQPPGRYLRVSVPLRRGGRHIELMGRIAASRAIGPSQFMVHAVLRGLDPKQRQLLHQVVMHEQSRRLKTLARIRPRKEQAG
jgi:hypothetical protein